MLDPTEKSELDPTSPEPHSDLHARAQVIDHIGRYLESIGQLDLSPSTLLAQYEQLIRSPFLIIDPRQSGEAKILASGHGLSQDTELFVHYIDEQFFFSPDNQLSDDSPRFNIATLAFDGHDTIVALNPTPRLLISPNPSEVQICSDDSELVAFFNEQMLSDPVAFLTSINGIVGNHWTAQSLSTMFDPDAFAKFKSSLAEAYLDLNTTKVATKDVTYGLNLMVKDLVRERIHSEKPFMLAVLKFFDPESFAKGELLYPLLSFFNPRFEAFTALANALGFSMLLVDGAGLRITTIPPARKVTHGESC